MLNASIGKLIYLNRTASLNINVNVENMLNNRNVKTGGYEQTRLVDSENFMNYYKFDSKYFYMQGVNYMLNLYFRF